MRHRIRFLCLVLLSAMAATITVASVQTNWPVLRVDGRSNATPWIAAAGRFVAVAWGATHDGRTDVFVAVSRDAANNFSRPVQVNTGAGEARLGGELPPRIALRPRPDGEPEIVVTWTARATTTAIKLARSVDGGRSFSAPLTLQSAAAPGDRGWPALALDHAGTAHVIWLDHRGLAANHARAADQHKTAVDGTTMAQRSGLFYVSSRGTVGAERELTPGVCYCCKTALAATTDGKLIAAWRHVYPGNLRDIAFAVSRDGGRRFSAPTRVSEDRWPLNGCPDDGPALVVDAQDTVHIVWPTVLPGPEPEGALFYSSTRDGHTFTRRVRVPTLGSPKPAHAQIAVRGDRLWLAWDEVINGVRVASVRDAYWSHGELVFGEIRRLQDEGGSAMYPVIAMTSDGPVVAWTSGPQGQAVVRVKRITDAKR
jgi:hypothetical protein